jgi:hypothetical protein
VLAAGRGAGALARPSARSPGAVSRPHLSRRAGRTTPPTRVPSCPESRHRTWRVSAPRPPSPPPRPAACASPNPSASCPDIATSVSTEAPVRRGRKASIRSPNNRHAAGDATIPNTNGLSRHPRQIAPASRKSCPRSHQPAGTKHRLAMLGPPTEHLQLHIGKLARRPYQPHSLRQRIHNMSSATRTRRPRAVSA